VTCRWDSDAGDYLVDGEPCRTDDYGDATKHCTARRTCSNHVGPGEITCAKCVGRSRMDLRRIVELAPLAMTQAIAVGVESEAANLAGPAADVEAWSWRKVTAKQGLVWHASLVEDDDDFHPYTVLTRWEFMLREDYGQQRSDATSIASAGAYLERTLGRMAQDEAQDFPLFAREVRACRNHLDAVLRNSSQPERGAPCPDCKEGGKVVRMSREYGHWCDDPACTRQFHYLDESGDRWVCPANRDHWRTHDEYVRWIEERTKVGA
jgi:hypothetical protein